MTPDIDAWCTLRFSGDTSRLKGDAERRGDDYAMTRPRESKSSSRVRVVPPSSLVEFVRRRGEDCAAIFKSQSPSSELLDAGRPRGDEDCAVGEYSPLREFVDLLRRRGEDGTLLEEQELDAWLREGDTSMDHEP